MPAECLTSGLTPEQSEGFLERLPNKWELFNFLFGIEEPLRLDDFQGFLRGNGLPEFLPPFPASDAMAYLAAPIRDRGRRAGSVYVSEKGGVPVLLSSLSRRLGAGSGVGVVGRGFGF